MTYTKEDVERLVPEADLHDIVHVVVITCGEKPGSRVEADLAYAILDTRHKLEIAREALEKIKKIDRDGDWEWVDSGPESDEYWMEKWAAQLNDCGKISEHALATIKELS